MTLSKEEKREAGFKKVYAYLHSEEVNKYCMNNRLYIERYEDDIDQVMAMGEKGTLITDRWENFGSRERCAYVRYQLGLRGIELVILNDDGAYRELVEAFIEEEKAFRLRRQKMAMDKKRENGEFCGGRVPYGYYSVDGKLYIEEYESFIVKFVFYRHTQGCTIRGIARELNLRKFKTRKKTEFKGQTVKNILERKEFYQGYINGVKGKHRPILGENDALLTKDFIDRTFNEEVEKKLMARKRQGKPKNIPYIIKR